MIESIFLLFILPLYGNLKWKEQTRMIKLLLSARLGEKRLTQADLARMTGIRPNTINELYHEIAERVSLEHLDLICEALECNLNDLITREPNKEPKIVHTRTGSSKSDENR